MTQSERKEEKSRVNKHVRRILTPNDTIMMEYSEPENIKSYSIVGLWISEEVFVDRYFKRSGSLLDIGCGAGRTTIALAKKGFYVTGIDIVPEMIKAARKQADKYNVEVDLKVMDASKLNFPDESFDDVLFSFNGYEHIYGKTNRDRVLKEVFRVLKPGGHFILTARSGLAFGKRWIAWLWMYIRHYVLRPFSIGNINLDLGDMIVNGRYHHYLSPFWIRKTLQENGFYFELFNSHRNLERNKKASFFTNFSTDKCLFYVARKPI